MRSAARSRPETLPKLRRAVAALAAEVESQDGHPQSQTPTKLLASGQQCKTQRPIITLIAAQRSDSELFCQSLRHVQVTPAARLHESPLGRSGVERFGLGMLRHQVPRQLGAELVQVATLPFVGHQCFTELGVHLPREVGFAARARSPGGRASASEPSARS